MRELSQHGCNLTLSDSSFVGWKRLSGRNERLASVEAFGWATISNFAHDAVKERWCDNACYGTTWTSV